ncbi:DUF6221 family protein [Streptosporangium sp. DT93]|uniref:DUF6221 family protein n=1 Tax=Streptosporangium sp. DT93 TaxID=3393428 RepID=UPI003CE77A88
MVEVVAAVNEWWKKAAGMTDLIAWLRAQIGEQLTKARAAEEVLDGNWYSPDLSEWALRHLGRAEGDHIAANPPCDVIARCEVELLLLDEHAAAADPYSPTGFVCKTCNDGGLPVEPACSPCRTVRLLAYGYRHRPGWREEWRP